MVSKVIEKLVNNRIVDQCEIFENVLEDNGQYESVLGLEKWHPGIRLQGKRC